MTPPAPAPPSPPSGEEARDAVRAVLEDQAERAGRRERASPPPPDRRRIQTAVAVALGSIAIWTWISPPGFVTPAPPPPPVPERVEAGLHMDLWVAAQHVEAYRNAHGSLPERLEHAVEDPEDAEGIAYARLDGGRYRLVAVRDEVTVSLEPDRDAEELAQEARSVLERAGR